MITHYLIIKIQDEHNNDRTIEQIHLLYNEMAQSIKTMHNLQISKNVVQRESNSDLMISMDFYNNDDLYSYLEHPLHKSFAKTIGPKLHSKMTFDEISIHGNQ